MATLSGCSRAECDARDDRLTRRFARCHGSVRPGHLPAGRDPPSMFGLTLAKLIVVVAVIVVWKGWRVAQAVLQGREAALQRQARPAPRSRPATGPRPRVRTELGRVRRAAASTSQRHDLPQPRGVPLPRPAVRPVLDRRQAPPLACTAAKSKHSPGPLVARTSPPSFQDLILTAAALLGGPGLRDPAALRHGGGRRHVPPGDDLARARARAVEAPPTSSPRAGRPTAATARTRTGCSTTTSSR